MAPKRIQSQRLDSFVHDACIQPAMTIIDNLSANPFSGTNKCNAFRSANNVRIVSSLPAARTYSCVLNAPSTLPAAKRASSYTRAAFTFPLSPLCKGDALFRTAPLEQLPAGKEGLGYYLS